jgi:hypothetical protein
MEMKGTRMPKKEEGFLEDERKFKMKNPAMTRMMKDYRRDTQAEAARRRKKEEELEKYV